MANIDYSKYGGQVLSNNQNIPEKNTIDYSKFGGQIVHPEKTWMQELGEKVKVGNPEQKSALETMINTGAPGMQITGVTGEIPWAIKTLMSKVVPHKLTEIVQKGHDILSEEASGIFDFIKDKAKDMVIKLPKDLLNDAKQYLPDTRRVKSLITDAEKGSYDALHSLQSELWKLGSKGLSADLPSAVKEGHEMLDVRSRINDIIQNHFINSGENDLAHLLTKARDRYRNLKDIYYSHPGVGKLVNPDIRKIPKNIMNFFSEQSVPMQKVIEKHPEIQKMLELSKGKKQIFDILKKAGVGTVLTGGTGAAVYTAKGVYDLMTRLLNQQSNIPQNNPNDI